MNADPTSGELPANPFEQIKTAAIGLLLDATKESGGGSGLSSRNVTFILSGESIGEGGTFFLLRCDLNSLLGLSVSMGQYSEFESVEQPDDEVYTAGVFASLGSAVQTAQETGPLTLVNFFDVEKDTIDGVGELDATDSKNSSDELDQLLRIMGHDELKQLIPSDIRDTRYGRTALYHNETRLALEHAAFLRVAGNSPAAIRFADEAYLGIWHTEETNTRQERVLPAIVRWLAEKLRRA